MCSFDNTRQKHHHVSIYTQWAAQKDQYQCYGRLQACGRLYWRCKWQGVMKLHLADACLKAQDTKDCICLCSGDNMVQRLNHWRSLASLREEGLISQALASVANATLGKIPNKEASGKFSSAMDRFEYMLTLPLGEVRQWNHIWSQKPGTVFTRLYLVKRSGLLWHTHWIDDKEDQIQQTSKKEVQSIPCETWETIENHHWQAQSRSMRTNLCV